MNENIDQIVTCKIISLFENLGIDKKNAKKYVKYNYYN